MLTAAQRRHFLSRGFLRLERCFPRKAAAEWVRRAEARIGFDLKNPRAWKQERVHLPATTGLLVESFAPKAWEAILELVGGLERLKERRDHAWPDSFVVNLRAAARSAWRGPDPDLGWHIDGPDRRRLDSPEVGLIVYVLWTDVGPKSGGTFLACDSLGPVARWLRDRPRGANKREIPFREEIIPACRDIAEATGKAGDVYLVHPLTAHAESQNASGRPRFMTPRIVELARPMRFDRPAGKSSLVEQAVLRGLGDRRPPRR